MKMLKYIILLIFLAGVTGCNNQDGTTAAMAIPNQNESGKTSVIEEKQVKNQNNSDQIYASVGSPTKNRGIKKRYSLFYSF